MKFDNRASYLKQLLQRTLSADVIDPAELTYDLIARASSTLTEYWQLTRKAEYDAALELNPQERQRRKQINEQNKASALVQRSIKNQLSPDELAQFQRNLDQVLAYYPVFLNCDDNGAIVANAIKTRRVNFLDEAQLEALIVDLVSAGSVYLNPAALGAKYAQRYGEDELSPGNQRISAADLRVFTTRRSQSVQDESRLSANEYWDAHPELAAERHKHSRAAVERDAIAKGQSEVARFLQTQLNYQPATANQEAMLNYLLSHKSAADRRIADASVQRAKTRTRKATKV